MLGHLAAGRRVDRAGREGMPQGQLGPLGERSSSQTWLHG